MRIAFASFLLFPLLVLAACKPESGSEPAPGDGPAPVTRDTTGTPPAKPEEGGGLLAIRGTLTNEGAECPAMRGADGTLYTLAGGTGAFKVGDEVCVRGRRAEMSTCQQGVTIAVESIGPAKDCP